MKRNILIFGLIAGIISTIGFLTVGTGNHFDDGMLYGFGSMLLAFSMIFVGIRNYRDKYNGGHISFGKALLCGSGIAFVASTVYVFTWQIDFFFFNHDFIDQYTAYLLEKMKKKGSSVVEIEKFLKEQAEFKVNYQKVWFNALVTYTEILPVGILVALICAAILKKKQVPAS
jgi:hypothetical protein